MHALIVMYGGGWNVSTLALLTIDGQLKLVDMSPVAVTDAPNQPQNLRGELVLCSQLCYMSGSATMQAC